MVTLTTACAGHNCEDILMAYLYAKHSREGPLLFQTELEDLGLSDGIWRQTGHGRKRTACIQRFDSFFGNETLVPSRFTLQGVT
jgi:hypothetical protein